MDRLRSRYGDIQRLEDCNQDRVRGILGQPGQTWGGVDLYDGVSLQAAVLLYGFAKGHPCGTGNKRIAAALLLVFLGLNGWRLDTNDRELEAIAKYAAASNAPDHAPVKVVIARWVADRLRGRGGQERWS